MIMTRLVGVLGVEMAHWEQATAQATSVVFEGKIWLLVLYGHSLRGGGDPAEDEEETDPVLIYDPTVDLWAEGPYLPNHCACIIATVRNGELYVVTDRGILILRNGAWERNGAWAAWAVNGLNSEDAACASVLLG